MISEKNILQTDSEGKNLAGKYLTYNGVVCQRKKNYISRGLGTKILPKPKHSYLSPLHPPPPSLKGHMVGLLYFSLMRDLGHPSWIFAGMI